MEIDLLKARKEIILILTMIIVSVIFAVGMASEVDYSSEENYLSLSDSLLINNNADADIDSISYVADSIYYDVGKEIIYLTQNAELTYHRSKISANQIIINLAANQAYTIGETWMRDGTQILFGKSVRYDLTTEKGMIYDGASRLEKGFYYGEEIRKVGDEVYDIDKGYFTTCEIAEPNFFIYSGRMRLFYQDKIVAKPILFYVNHFPIFMLPFGTFPVKTERASGILVPEPGYNSTDGKYVENISLYYGYNDYAELLTTLDWREYTGWEVRLDSNYILRYNFSGNLLARFQHRIMNQERARQEWYIRAQHRHDFLDRSSLDANLEFMSSRDVWEGSEDIDQRLTERIRSTISYRKPFQATTLNIGATYTENLLEKTKQVVLPTFSYTLPSKPVHELFQVQGGARTERWWQNLYYSYSIRGAHYGDITKPSPSLAEILYKNVRDEDDRYLAQHNLGLRHSISLSFNRTIAGWLNFSQSINGTEVWFDRDRLGNSPARGFDYRTNSRLSHSIYGLGYYPDFPVTAVRHIITPSLSFNYSPDYSDRVNQYYSFSGLSISSTPKRRNLSFGLNNSWSFKYTSSDTQREKALNDFFTTSSSISYDLEKDKKPFSDISHSIGFRPGSISLGDIVLAYSSNLSLRQDAYNFDILNWRISNTMRISGEANYYNYFPQKENVFFSKAASQSDTLGFGMPEDHGSLVNDLSRLSSQHPWNLNISHDYSKVMETKRTTQNIRASTSFRLTQNWSINYSNYYNIELGKLISQSLSVDRDLLCWRLTFTWSKQGDYWNYRLKFYNIQLPDVLRIRRTEYKRERF